MRTNIMSSREFVVSCLTLLVAGCGQGAYDELVQAKLQELQRGTAFLEQLHGGPTDIIRNVASLQLPKIFDENSRALNSQTPDDVTRKPMDVNRIQPPFAHLPGFRFCYEKFMPIAGASLPIYCYFAAVDSNDKDAAALRGELQKALRAKFRAAAWNDISLDTPTGEQIQLKKISCNGPQSFYLEDGTTKDANGRFDLYLYSTPQHHLLVGWRAPRELGDQTRLFEVAELSLGSLEAEAPAG